MRAAACVTGVVALVLAGCADGTAPAPSDGAGPRIELAPSAVSLTAIGELGRLEAAAFDGAGIRLDSATFTWWSSDPDVAFVDSTGIVRAVRNGVATVTASWADLSGSARVTVQQAVGGFYKVSGDFQDGIAGEVLPAPLVARVTDRFGTGIAGVPVYFRVVSGSGTFDMSSPSSDSTGTVRVRWTIPVPGEHVAQASLQPGQVTPALYNALVR